MSAVPPKPRKEWRRTDTPWIAWFDVIWLRGFIFGGDVEWVRRRYFMVLSLGIGLFSTIAACISSSIGRLPAEITKTIVDGYFTMIMAVVPAYILGAVWDAKNKLDSGAAVSETKEVVTEPERITETTTKEINPAPPGTEKLPQEPE